MKKILIGVIIGILSTSVVTVTALKVYKANEIIYNPSDESWNVENVSDALNDLWNDTQCIKGTYNHASNTNWNIEIGFIPSSLSVNFTHERSRVYLTYDKKISSKVWLIDNNISSGVSAVQDFSDLVNISEVLTSNLTDAYKTYTSAYLIYYVACK